MICPRCEGRNDGFPCELCGGCGVAYCCEGMLGDPVGLAQDCDGFLDVLVPAHVPGVEVARHEPALVLELPKPPVDPLNEPLPTGEG